jgi:hypothetical protein
MKKSNIILLIILMTVSLMGCQKDLLDTVPNDRIAADLYWQTDQDAVYAANYIYTFLDNATRYTNWDAMTEIGHVSKSTNSESLVEKGVMDPSSSVFSSTWNNLYYGIQAANKFFKNVDLIAVRDQDLINRLKGEVRALRAYYYTELAALWGDVPLVTTETSLEESRNLTRTPVSEVWDFISEELTEAASILPVTYGAADKGRLTKGAALAMNARAMLYAGRFDDAADAAKLVMDLEVYDLYPSYKGLFTYANENNQEVVFDKQYMKSSYPNNLYLIMCANSLYPQSTANIVPTRQAVNIYQMTNGKEISDPASGFDPYHPYADRDPRLKYNYAVIGSVLINGSIYDSRPGFGTADAVGSSEIATATGFNMQKYVTSEDVGNPSNGGLNTIFIRYADVLLMYAEARIELNQIDESVMNAINRVRQRPDVNMPAYTGTYTQDELRQIVRDERVRELPFEGLHYFDIRRWRTAEDVIPGMLLGMEYVDINGDLQEITLPGYVRAFAKNRDYLWPIPQKELDLNPNLIQNPGY